MAANKNSVTKQSEKTSNCLASEFKIDPIIEKLIDTESEENREYVREHVIAHFKRFHRDFSDVQPKPMDVVKFNQELLDLVGVNFLLRIAYIAKTSNNNKEVLAACAQGLPYVAPKLTGVTIPLESSKIIQQNNTFTITDSLKEQAKHADFEVTP